MIVACVRTGDKYSVDYVTRLQAAVSRHMPVDYRFVCLTDKPSALASVCETIDISMLYLPGWWGKMALFKPDWRRGEDVVYLDLDTVVIGSLFPLAALTVDFGICANFTRAAGHTDWPCRYGSCVMKIGAGTLIHHVWDMFDYDRGVWMEKFKKTGDQHLIENALPDATLLQEVLPAGFFLGYRDLASHLDAPPLGCSLVVFAGSHKPDNSKMPWVRAAWEGRQ